MDRVSVEAEEGEGSKNAALCAIWKERESRPDKTALLRQIALISSSISSRNPHEVCRAIISLLLLSAPFLSLSLKHSVIRAHTHTDRNTVGSAGQSRAQRELRTEEGMPCWCERHEASLTNPFAAKEERDRASRGPRDALGRVFQVNFTEP